MIFKRIFSLLMISIGTSIWADGSSVKLGGYCPVAYVSADKALYGDANQSSLYKGSLYYFINKDAKAVFDKEPDKFVSAIQYDAYCATGVALGKKLNTDPKLFSKVKGKVYFFSSEDAKKMFDKDQSAMISKAEGNWKKVKNLN